MRILFVKADKIGSKIIRWGTGEPASHVALDFGESYLYHSYATGIETIPLKEFKKLYGIVGNIDIKLVGMDEIRVLNAFKKLLPKEQHYDYSAIAYFAYRAALKKFFNKPYPTMNTWNESDGFLCTEITYILAEALSSTLGKMILPLNHDFSMITPWGLFNLLKEELPKCAIPFSYYSSV